MGCSARPPPSGAVFWTAWRWRWMPSILAASPRSSGRCAPATGCWRSRGPTRTGSLRSRSTTAEVARGVAAQRAETVARLQQALRARDPASAFPSSEIALKGWIEELVLQRPAIEVEDRYRAVLKDNRPRDAAAGRTLDGPHLTDLAVTYARKNIPAADASTGEQKALLIGLVLAHASLLAVMSGFAPVLLLDEVVAHLDPARRSALYGDLEQLGAQVWMTGADPAAFAEIEPQAQVFEVAPGRVARKGAGV